MSVILQSSGGGQITVQEPATASNFTQTLPAATGTVMVSGNMPAFSAYGTALQSISNATYTKIAFNTESFDTNSNYDSTTNYRFTPTVAGYYQINAQSLVGSGVATSIYLLAIRKNGANAVVASASLNSTNTLFGAVSGLLYLNGSTDYVEVFIYQSSGGALNCGSSSDVVSFSGSLVRAA
jgi:hypothetical protein